MAQHLTGIGVIGPYVYIILSLSVMAWSIVGLIAWAIIALLTRLGLWV
jgi:hypothetical protein